MNRREKISITLKCAVFMAIFVFLFNCVSNIFGVPDDKFDNRGRVRAFYEQPKNTIDVCLIGASSFYRGWSSMEAWKDFGITSWAYATSAQPSGIRKFIIKDVMKTQKPTVFIIDVRNFLSIPKAEHKSVEGNIRKVVDNMPFSINRINAINNSLDTIGIESDDNRIEWYFSFYKFHNRWENDLSMKDFTQQNNRFQGTHLGEEVFLVKKVNPPVFSLSSNAILDDYIKNSLSTTISYIKEENLPVLFVALPFSMNENKSEKLNAILSIIQENDMPCLNLTNKASEIGIAYDQDFFDNKHLNYWGSKKMTKWLAEYLIEHYGIKDHRGDIKYKIWNTAEKDYNKELSRYLKQTP
jgi:hypothetical protein